MQRFTDYVKQPSNWQDFVTLFASEAKFRPNQVSQTERKLYFRTALDDIMIKYLMYLKNQDLFQAKSQKELIEKIHKGEMQHGDLVMYFTSWLDLEDNIFYYEPKSKVPPAKAAQVKSQSSQSEGKANASSLSKGYDQKQPTVAKSPRHQGKSPRNQGKSPRNQGKSPKNQGKFSYSQSKKQAQNQPSGPYIVTKVVPSQQAISHHQQQQQQQHQHIPYPNPNNNRTKPLPQIMPSHYYTQKAKQQSQQMYASLMMFPAQEVKPLRMRLYEKLADLLEYPQRAPVIRQNIAKILDQKKR